MAFGLTFVVIAGEIDISVMLDAWPSRPSASPRSVERGSERLARGAGGARRRGRPRARERPPRRTAEPALARGHPRHAGRLPRARVRRSSAARSIAAFPTGFTNIGGGYIRQRAAVRAARPARRRARARRAAARDAIRALPLHDRLEPGGGAVLRDSRRPRPGHDLRALRADGRRSRRSSTSATSVRSRPTPAPGST